ncbi:MAG: M16 family metallopeptidase [Elainellaceae cyanobacterium]
MQRFEFWRNKLVRYGLATFMTLFAVVMVLGRSPALATPAQHYTELEFPPLPEIQIPEYTYFELDNGMQVYLMEDHELPLVNGSAMIHTGDRLDPDNQVGLAGITGEVIRSGGTTVHPAEELNLLLEQQAASVETGINTSSGTANFSALSEDVPNVLSLFAEVIRQPAFPQDKIDLAKTQRQGAIARRNDDPDEIARREFQKLIYGKESPYARTIEYETLDNISRDDLIRFYEQYFHPSNMMLGVVGDFDPAEMRLLIEEAFGDWPSGPNLDEAIEKQLPTVTQANQSGVFVVDQPQLTQSSIQIGHLGGRLDNPDYAALSVMNEVMNGLGGRLVNEVRSRQGLAYSVYAVWSPRFDYPGMFIGGGQTRTDATVPFIQAALAEIEEIRTTPITEEELNRAQDGVLNSFVFNFQNPGQTLSRVMRYAYYDYPEDFIFSYQRDIAATTIEQVQEAAQTYLKPDMIVTLVVGNKSEIQPPLSDLNPDTRVTQIDVTIPEPRG